MYGTFQSVRAVGVGTYYLGAPLSRRTVRRRISLGALTADQAAEQVFPQAQVKSSAGHNQSVRDQIVASVNAGQLVGATGAVDYVPGTPGCRASGISSNLKLAQTSAGLALTGTTIGLAAAGVATAAALAPFTMGISAIIGLFPVFFGHHAQAVKKEQSILCSAVPAANNYLTVIDQAVAAGQATPAQGIAALSSLLSDFASQVSSIRHGTDPTSSGECNAACVEYSKLHAIVLARSSQYQDLQAQQTAAASNPVAAVQNSLIAPIEQALTVSGLPSWLLPAAAFFALWEIL